MNKLPQAVTEAKAKGEQVLELEGDGGTAYYFKAPGKTDLERYMASAAKGKLALGISNLVSSLALHPTAEELKAQFEDKPGRMVAISNALQTAIGLNEEFSVKKL